MAQAYGWDDARLTAEANWRRSYEPVFVLKAKAPEAVEPTEPEHTEL